MTKAEHEDAQTLRMLNSLLLIWLLMANRFPEGE